MIKTTTILLFTLLKKLERETNLLFRTVAYPGAFYSGGEVRDVYALRDTSLGTTK